MKFNPTWPQVALLVVLLAAVILTHIFAPLAISVITSLVSTIVGALFVNLQPQADATEKPLAPVLSIVKDNEPKGDAS